MLTELMLQIIICSRLKAVLPIMVSTFQLSICFCIDYLICSICLVKAPLYPPPERNIHPAPAYVMNNPAMESTVYTHNQPHILADEFPEQPGQPECSYFLKTGDCKFKSNCKYHHPKNQISKSLPCALSDKGLPLRPIILKMEVLLYVGSKIKILAVAIVPKEKASTLFLKYLSWKQSFVPNGYISPSEITNQFEDNKVCMQGLDKKGRPIMVAFGGRHNPSKGSLDDFNRFVVFTLDKDCYPERIGKLFIVHSPYIFMTAWKVFYPFIESITKKKVKYPMPFLARNTRSWSRMLIKP
ncbi:hypothetical protein Q3G72_032332 [Acer saccharum]|nr:hypothetical protein Q3G72_032332 [Acer saccharum]